MGDLHPLVEESPQLEVGEEKVVAVIRKTRPHLGVHTPTSPRTLKWPY